MLTAIGSKFPNVPGLFGGYGCPTYPLARVRGVDVFEAMKTDPGRFRFSIAEMMNERPFEDAEYSTHPMSLPYALASRGELYMIAQGTGGGFGDPLERDPADVMRDYEEDLISPDVAWRIYRVVFDPQTRIVDEAATAEARDAVRKERLAGAMSYDAFCARHVTSEPPADLPYYGSWGDPETIYGGSPDRCFPAGHANAPVVMPNPMQVKIEALEKQIAELRGAA